MQPYENPKPHIVEPYSQLYWRLQDLKAYAIAMGIGLALSAPIIALLFFVEDDLTALFVSFMAPVVATSYSAYRLHRYGGPNRWVVFGIHLIAAMIIYVLLGEFGIYDLSYFWHAAPNVGMGVLFGARIGRGLGDASAEAHRGMGGIV